MIFYDTETCGFHGMCVLIQWAEDDGPVHLHHIWTQPAINTLKLIEWMMEHELCGFNLAFDHFHLCKLYTILSLIEDVQTYPEDIIQHIATLEPLGRDGQCVKPRAACDIMLHARKGKYQSTMDRKDIVVRKIPAVLCEEVRQVLEEEVKLDDIYFARRKDKLSPKWRIRDRDDCDDFKDIVLKFKASSALKNLAIHALKIPHHKILQFGEIGVSDVYTPIEAGYAPFALALSTPEKGWAAKVKKGGGWKRGFCWPAVIEKHITHWMHNPMAKKYAEDDVHYTRDLWKHLGSPVAGDDDSELACMVAAVRWKGFKINKPYITELRDAALIKSKTAPTAPKQAKIYITQVMSEKEKLYFDTTTDSTEKLVLEELAKWEVEDMEESTFYVKEKPLRGQKANSIIVDEDVDIYHQELTAEEMNKEVVTIDPKKWIIGTPPIRHAVAIRAQSVLEARQAAYEYRQFNKLLVAGRFQASMKVIGALSGRMSGADELNAQGINRDKEIRKGFDLAGKGLVLCGGDFDSFEVVLAIVYYGDKKLAEAITSGKKIHALFGMHVYPDMTYDEIMNDQEKYNRSKSAVFALIYFGNAYTLKTRLGVSMEVAEKAYQEFIKDYPGIGEGRKKITEMFCTMQQSGGIGTHIQWNEPVDYIESMFGFRRYFTLENQICKTIFNLARKPPKHWKEHTQKVTRRDREQTVSGAVQSALYAAAFGLQAANMRAAGNHVIQSSGAQITKNVQRTIWDEQPVGVSEWMVQPMNIHDEIMCPTHPSKINRVEEIVNARVEHYKKKVPLIKMEWKTDLSSWADK